MVCQGLSSNGMEFGFFLDINVGTDHKPVLDHIDSSFLNYYYLWLQIYTCRKVHPVKIQALKDAGLYGLLLIS